MTEFETPLGHWGQKNPLPLPKACWWKVVQSSHPHDCPPSRFMTDAARREQESLKKKIQPKLSLTLSSTVSRGNVSTPPRHSSGSLTPPVTPPITPSSSFRSSTPTGKHLLFDSSQTKGAVLLPGIWRTGDLGRQWEEVPRKIKQKSLGLFYIWFAFPKMCLGIFFSKSFAKAEQDTNFKCCSWNHFMKKLTLPETPNVQKTPYVSIGELCPWYSISWRLKKKWSQYLPLPPRVFFSSGEGSGIHRQ